MKMTRTGTKFEETKGTGEELRERLGVKSVSGHAHERERGGSDRYKYFKRNQNKMDGWRCEVCRVVQLSVCTRNLICMFLVSSCRCIVGSQCNKSIIIAQ